MKLKPCPFCGGEARLGWFSEEDIPYAVYCLDGCCAHKAYETETEAIEAWNRREPIDKIVEQLEEEKGIAFVTLANTGVKELDFAYQNVVAYMDKAIEIVKGGNT